MDNKQTAEKGFFGSLGKGVSGFFAILLFIILLTGLLAVIGFMRCDTARETQEQYGIVGLAFQTCVAEEVN